MHTYIIKKAVALLPFLSLNALAQLNFPQDTIAYNDRFNNRQSVMFDSRGRLHVVYSSELGTTASTREIFYVTDSASTFLRKQITSNAVDDNYPTIMVDRNDDVHVCFEGRDPANLFQVQYSRLVNGVFTDPMYITQGGENKATPFAAIGMDSVIHFVYFTYPPSGTQYAYHRTYDLRDSLLSPELQLTNASVTGDFDAAVATDTAGFVHIVVKSGSAFGGPLKYYTNRTGSLVETPTGVAGNVDYPRVLVDKRNVVHILYRNTSTLILNTINNASGSFGAPVPLTPPGQRPGGYHNFAVDGENRLFIVYQSSVSSSGKGFYLVNGKDGVFSDTISVYDLPPGYLTRNTSAIAAREDGEIAVTYSPGASRSGSVVCDIFLKRGTLETTAFEIHERVPLTTSLAQNYPNPFNPSTRIGYSLARTSFVTLTVHNTLGQEIARLVNEQQPPGYHERIFHGDGLASGVYFYRIQAEGFSASRKLLLLR